MRNTSFLPPGFKQPFLPQSCFFCCVTHDALSVRGNTLYTNILINVFVGSSGHQSMASALAPPVASTTETTNYARLCRLLVDVGSHALRDTFDTIHPPAGLHSVLVPGTPAHGTLQLLRKKRILNPTQWGKLYPTIRLFHQQALILRY